MPDTHLTPDDALADRVRAIPTEPRASADPGGLPWPHRVLYLLTALAAGWIAYFGLFAPAQIEEALSWPVPPLHAAFFGALYLSGSVLLVSAVLARRTASACCSRPGRGDGPRRACCWVGCGCSRSWC